MHIFDNEQDVNIKLIRKPSQRSALYHGPIPHKKIKESPQQKAFYIIENKIYAFTDIGNFQEIIIELNNISESISRPAHINEFQITQNSLLRAKALGYSSKTVKNFLKKNMKNNQIPSDLQMMLQKGLDSSACPKLYLVEKKQKNIYYLEIPEKQLCIRPNLLTVIQEFTDINKMEYVQMENAQEVKEQMVQVKEIKVEHNSQKSKSQEKIRKYPILDYKHNQLSEKMFAENIALSSEKIIQKNQFKQQMQTMTHVITNKQALHCKDLKISLKAFTKLRDYQSQALKSVVTNKQGNLVAKSGYIVLPCGAGKTLLGISICCKIKKQTLIVCSSDSGADQWKKQIQKWTQGIHKDTIVILTAKTMNDTKFSVKDKRAHIYISTYSNLKSKFQPKQGQIKSDNIWLKRMPWGLVVFDEAQWLPAKGNKFIINSLLAHVKIGLTATPLREDDCIKSLIYMLGPQLYEGSWKKFVEQGFLANPKCLQIRTSMTNTFRQLYQATVSNKSKQLQIEKQMLYESNPNKVKALMFLLDYHQALNDNIIVFCDNISLITYLASRLKRPLLRGQTENEDRNFVFDMFRQGKFKTIFLTRIGDQAIDLPNANVAIQIAMHKGSRRQMMQRLGRIMRPKQASSSQSHNAIFYTIVSEQTLQMKYFQKRRNYLVNLGFQYDLRLFEYSAQESMDDIYKSDLEKKEIIEEKFKTIIPDQHKYFLALTQNK